jgi:hypothetical protein
VTSQKEVTNMSDLLPGLSDDQAAAVEFALRMVPPQLHDGICVAIHAGLGGGNGPYGDQQVMASVVVALIRCSGLNIPGPLFASDINVRADTNQVLAVGAGLSAGAGLKAN